MTAPKDVGPRELDVVKFTRSIDGWAAGTEGTIVHALSDTHGLVEIAGTTEFDTVVVPYSAVTVVWTLGRR